MFEKSNLTCMHVYTLQQLILVSITVVKGWINNQNHYLNSIDMYLYLIKFYFVCNVIANLGSQHLISYQPQLYGSHIM